MARSVLEENKELGMEVEQMYKQGFSLRDIEEELAERGISLSYQSIKNYLDRENRMTQILITKDSEFRSKIETRIGACFEELDDVKKQLEELIASEEDNGIKIQALSKVKDVIMDKVKVLEKMLPPTPTTLITGTAATNVDELNLAKMINDKVKEYNSE